MGPGWRCGRSRYYAVNFVGFLIFGKIKAYRSRPFSIVALAERTLCLPAADRSVTASTYGWIPNTAHTKICALLHQAKRRFFFNMKTFCNMQRTEKKRCCCTGGAGTSNNPSPLSTDKALPQRSDEGQCQFQVFSICSWASKMRRIISAIAWAKVRLLLASKCIQSASPGWT